jgi:hypothetical protein
MRILTLVFCVIALLATWLPLVNAFAPLFRYPLDHIFYSKEFGLITLQKLEHIGSDHFPLLIRLNYEPDDDNTEGLEETNADEEAEVEEKIEDGIKEGAVN